MAPPAPGAPGQMYPCDSPHREGAAECAALISPSCCPTVPRGLHGAQHSLVTRGVIALAGLAMAPCHLRVHPGLRGCGAGARGWSSSAWEISLSQGCRLPRKDGALGAAPGGAIVPLPACPTHQGCVLSPLHSHRCRVHSTTLSKGCGRDPALPSGKAGGRAARWVPALASGSGSRALEAQCCQHPWSHFSRPSLPSPA